MIRNTQQRDAISKVIETSPRPLNPKEICEEAQQRLPNLGIATVYRNIKSLLEEGKIVPVVIPGQPPTLRTSRTQSPSPLLLQRL